MAARAASTSVILATRDRHLDLDRPEPGVTTGPGHVRRPGAPSPAPALAGRLSVACGRPAGPCSARVGAAARLVGCDDRDVRRPVGGAAARVVGVLKLNSRTSARAVAAMATIARRFGRDRSSRSRSVHEPLGVDLGRRAPRGRGASAGRRPSSTSGPQTKTSRCGDVWNKRARATPARAARSASPRCRVGRPGSGRSPPFARGDRVELGAEDERPPSGLPGRSSVISPGRAGSSSSSARSGVMPIPPATSRTRERVRRAPVSAPYGPSTKTRRADREPLEPVRVVAAGP